MQLPRYSTFGTNTSVLVPDRGNAVLGGVRRAAEGRSEFGSPLLPGKQRAIGRTAGSAGVSASVYIHDFEALEAELLSQSPGGRATPPARPTEIEPAVGIAALVRVPRDIPLPSVAAIRAERARRQRLRAEGAANVRSQTAATRAASPPNAVPDSEELPHSAGSGR